MPEMARSKTTPSTSDGPTSGRLSGVPGRSRAIASVNSARSSPGTSTRAAWSNAAHTAQRDHRRGVMLLGGRPDDHLTRRPRDDVDRSPCTQPRMVCAGRESPRARRISPRTPRTRSANGAGSRAPVATTVTSRGEDDPQPPASGRAAQSGSPAGRHCGRRTARLPRPPADRASALDGAAPTVDAPRPRHRDRGAASTAAPPAAGPLGRYRPGGCPRCATGCRGGRRTGPERKAAEAEVEQGLLAVPHLRRGTQHPGRRVRRPACRVTVDHHDLMPAPGQLVGAGKTDDPGPENPDPHQATASASSLAAAPDQVVARSLRSPQHLPRRPLGRHARSQLRCRRSRPAARPPRPLGQPRSRAAPADPSCSPYRRSGRTPRSRRRRPTPARPGRGPGTWHRQRDREPAAAPRRPEDLPGRGGRRRRRTRARRRHGR